MIIKPKDIAARINRMSGKYNTWDIFADWVEMSAIAISNAVDYRQRDQREARYMQIVKRYDKEEAKAISELLAMLVEALEASPGDILGEVFSLLEIHNTQRGQYFTPYHICRLMANVLHKPEEMRAWIENRGHMTLLEPSCGAGAMIIAFAENVREAGFEPRGHLHVTAQDIDIRAVHMCYLQLSLLDIPARVILGDTLRCEQREVWYTPAHVLRGWSAKLRRDDAEKEAKILIEAEPEPQAEVLAQVVAVAPVVEAVHGGERGQLLLF